MQPFRVLEGNHLFEPVIIEDGWETWTCDAARGYIWLFEAPTRAATYVISNDPAEGTPGWDRSMPNDKDGDNSVIHVWRVGKQVKKLKRDGSIVEVPLPCYTQCAEFAAPVDYVETARILNALGRLYSGSNSLGQAHCIIEVYPGPGGLVLREMVAKYGYVNFYQPKYVNTLVPEGNKNVIGWQANVKTVRDLWLLGRRIFNTGQGVVRSPWLISEMETTNPINFMNSVTSEAQPGFRDDRLRAGMLSFRAIVDVLQPIVPVTTSTVEKGRKQVSWQASDISAKDMYEAWNDRWDDIVGD